MSSPKTPWQPVLIAEIASRIYGNLGNNAHVATQEALYLLDLAEAAANSRQKSVDESIIAFRQEALKIKLEMKAEKNTQEKA